MVQFEAVPMRVRIEIQGERHDGLEKLVERFLAEMVMSSSMEILGVMRFDVEVVGQTLHQNIVFVPDDEVMDSIMQAFIAKFGEPCKDLADAITKRVMSDMDNPPPPNPENN